MFVGHYGPSFAIKSVRPAIPLWLLFIGVQLVDVAWAILVLLGIEKVRIVPGITASNPLDLYYMPYTHSLVAAFIWSIAAALLVRTVLMRSTTRASILVGAAVFSHWVLDLLVHRPDLPIYDDTMKVGIGLWNYPTVALVLEAALLFVGLILYLRTTQPVNAIGRFGPIVFAVLILVIQVFVFFGPPPTSPSAAAITALVSYAAFASVAEWLSSQRKHVASRANLFDHQH